MSRPLLTQPYATTYYPPVPVLSIEVSEPEMEQWYGPYIAMVDSGADFTIVPVSIIEKLQILSEREAVLSGQWKDQHFVEIYEIDLRLGSSILPGVEVAKDSTATEILLGRNILNFLDIQLNGPQLELRLLNI